MNVLAVDQFGEIGGAQRCLLDLLGGWPADTRTVIVAAPDGGPLLASLARCGFETRALPCGPYALGRKTASDAIRFAADYFRQRTILRDIIEQNAIDVVYVNGPRVLPAACAAARGRARVVFHAHNYLSRGYDLDLVRLSLARCDSAVIACCEYVAGPLRDRLPCPVQVIVNGVPEVRVQRRQARGSHTWRIGMVGRISREKGHVALIEASRMLAREGRSLTVSIVGAAMFGDAGYESEVRRRAEGLDVRFPGWTNDIAPVLSQLDLLAVPSLAEPGLPRIVLEAFSARVPVVAFPTGGIPEAVRHLDTGFLAMNTTALGLADAIRDVMELPSAESLRVTRNARAAWEERWNIERWRREVLAVIGGSAGTSEQRQQRSAGTCSHGAAAGATERPLSAPR